MPCLHSAHTEIKVKPGKGGRSKQCKAKNHCIALRLFEAVVVSAY